MSKRWVARPLAVFLVVEHPFEEGLGPWKLSFYDESLLEPLQKHQQVASKDGISKHTSGDRSKESVNEGNSKK